MASPFLPAALALHSLQLLWLCQAEASALVLGLEQVADVPGAAGAAAWVSLVLPAWKKRRRLRHGRDFTCSG